MALHLAFNQFKREFDSLRTQKIMGFLTQQYYIGIEIKLTESIDNDNDYNRIEKRIKEKLNNLEGVEVTKIQVLKELT